MQELETGKENVFVFFEYVMQDVNLKHTEVIVLSIILQYYKKYQKCYLSNEYFMLRLRTQREADVSETLKSLAKKGYLSIEKKGHKRLLIPIPAGFEKHFEVTNNVTQNDKNSKSEVTNVVSEVTNVVSEVTNVVSEVTNVVSEVTNVVIESKVNNKEKKINDKINKISEAGENFTYLSYEKNLGDVGEDSVFSVKENIKENGELGGVGMNEKNIQTNQLFIMPYFSEKFLESWQDYITQRQLLAGTPPLENKRVQNILNDLGKYEETFCIHILQRATAQNYLTPIFKNTPLEYKEWQNTQKNGKSTNNQNAGTDSQRGKESDADFYQNFFDNYNAGKFSQPNNLSF
jgi:hypothetical protein